MLRQQLFQYAVIRHAGPTNPDQSSEIVIEPKFVVAANEQMVVMRATREIPDAMMEYPDRLEVAVRPF